MSALLVIESRYAGLRICHGSMRHGRRWRIFLSALSLGLVELLFFAASAFAQTAGMDPERLKAIPVRMQAFVDQGTAAGFVTLLARHGQVAQLAAVGFQDQESRKPMRTVTIFQIASMTKPVTALGVPVFLDEASARVPRQADYD